MIPGSGYKEERRTVIEPGSHPKPNRTVRRDMVAKPAKNGVAQTHIEYDDPTIEYPSSDGEPLAESDFQYIPLTETVSALRIHFKDRSDVYIAGDMLIYYKMNDSSMNIAPDLFGVIGASGNHRRHSWIVWREGDKEPDFVMEIASESTWRRDAAKKRDIHAQLGVTEYWRFDPMGRLFTPPLIGERLVDEQYQPIPVIEDSSGILRGSSSIPRLDFCVLEGLELRIYDPVRGEWLRNHQEAPDAARAAEERIRELEVRLRG